MKEMVQSNSVKLSDEAMKLLEEEDGEDFRTEMKRTQVALNKRRKAHARLQRLKEALSTKHEQFRAFKQTLREQLQAQQEKYLRSSWWPTAPGAWPIPFAVIGLLRAFLRRHLLARM